MIEIDAGIRLLRADNPGPMTLDGTNTWLLGDPGVEPLWVVDPGPLIPGHLAAIEAAGPIAGIVLTHRHLDHSESASELADRVGCEIWAADPQLRTAGGELSEHSRLPARAVAIEVLATPGHTSDSTSLLLTSRDESVRLLTGDMVLGRGTTVIMHPDGDLGAYLDSLDRMLAVVIERGVREILPGHGPVVDDPADRLTSYRTHRLERLDQVRAAVAAGDADAEAVVARVYADVDRQVWPAATLSVQAQLAYLDREAQ